MAVDTSMYGMIKPIDAMGSINDGMQMRDMIDTRAQKKASNKFDMAVKNAQFGAQILGAAKNQQEWDSGLKQLQEYGMDASKLPGEFTPENQRLLVDSAMTVGERLSEQHRQKDYGLRQEEMASRSLDRRDARDERRFQSGIKDDEKMQALETPYGRANTLDDAKNLKTAFETKESFDGKLSDMISLREKHSGGAILNRQDVARGKQLSKDVLLAYKDMAKLGVLSKSDEHILNQIIPEDPLEYNSPLAAIQGQDPTLHRLKSFRADSNKDFETKVGTRTRAGIGNVASGAPIPPAGASAPVEMPNYKELSDEDLFLMYKQRVVGTKNANAR